MFELNIATLPNSILYLEGVQLSYIKVYVHIFNLWHSQNSCFISNAEFARRTGLHRDTVINAIQFFEKHGILKRIQKNGRRYLVQSSKYIETTDDPINDQNKDDKSTQRGSELDQGGVGVRPPGGSELDHHNNKINNKKEKRVKREREKVKSTSLVSIKKSPPPQTPIDINFEHNDEHELLAAQAGCDLEEEKLKFIDYYRSTGKKMVDWLAAFNNWLRKAKEYKKNSGNKEHRITRLINYALQ